MPQRFLRPGITTSDAWNACGWKAQSLYIRLITLVDDYGRYDGRIAIIHGHCFPLRSDIKPQETAALVDELSKSGLVELYQVEGKDYLQMLKWHERTRGDSKYPDPKNGQILRIPADSCEILPPSSLAISHKPSPLPPMGNQSDETWISELKAKTLGVDVDSELRKMDRWLLANPHRKKTRKFIVGWINRADKEMPKSSSSPKLRLSMAEHLAAEEAFNARRASNE